MNSRRQRVLLTAVAIVAAAAFSGCGGDDSPDTTPFNQAEVDRAANQAKAQAELRDKAIANAKAAAGRASMAATEAEAAAKAAAAAAAAAKTAATTAGLNESLASKQKEEAKKQSDLAAAAANKAAMAATEAAAQAARHADADKYQRDAAMSSAAARNSAAMAAASAMAAGSSYEIAKALVADRIATGAAPGNSSGSPVSDLGDWNNQTTGRLDIRAANNALRAYYDASGGHVIAANPVQPTGSGLAIWKGRWLGRIEVSSEPGAATGLRLLGVDANDLKELGDEARVSVHFESHNALAFIHYKANDLTAFGIDGFLGFSSKGDVKDGKFEHRPAFFHKTHGVHTRAGIIRTTLDLKGKAAFGGTNAEGVIGYLGGPMSIDYGRGSSDLGNFESVFYGRKE